MNDQDVLALDEAAVCLEISRRTIFRWLDAGYIRPISKRQKGKALQFLRKELEAVDQLIADEHRPPQVIRVASLHNLMQILVRCKDARALVREAESIALDAAEILYKNTGDPKALELLHKHQRFP